MRRGRATLLAAAAAAAAALGTGLAGGASASAVARGAAAPATPAPPAGAAIGPAAALPVAARGLRSRPRFGRRRPTYRPARRSARRNGSLRRLVGGVLRLLGIAYLLNLLFGWGPGGGSPLGLLIVAGVAVWLIVRLRRRRAGWHGAYGR